MSFFRLVPNIVIMAPKDFKELEKMLEFAVTLKKPVVIRYPRGGEGMVNFEKYIAQEEKIFEEAIRGNKEKNEELRVRVGYKSYNQENSETKEKRMNKMEFKDFINKRREDFYTIKYGKAEILKFGKDVTIIAIGKTVSKAMEIAKKLEKEEIQVEVINARFLKPLDKYKILDSINKTRFVVTIEDGTNINGLGTAVKELIVDNKIKGVKIKVYAYPDLFIKHGNVEELEKNFGVDSRSIFKYIKFTIKKERKYVPRDKKRTITSGK